MSIEYVALALNHSTLTGVARLVLIGIANHTNDDEGAWPSIETLARYAGTSERSVRRGIAEAVAAGELEVEHNAGGTHKTRQDRRPNLYHLRLECPPNCDHSPQHRMSDKADTSDSGRTHTSSRDNQREDAHVLPSTVTGGQNRYEREDITSSEPLEEPLDLLPSVSPEPTDRARTGPTDRPVNQEPTPIRQTPTDPRLTDPGFLRFLAAVAPTIRRPDRFDWPPGELDALEARWRSPDPFAAHHNTPTPIPPRFNPADHRPANAVPPPPDLFTALRRPTA